MKIINRLMASVLAIFALKANAAVEDTTVVPSTISMVEYCGFTDFPALTFTDWVANQPYTYDKIEVDVTITCPAGTYYLLYPSGSYYQSIGNGMAVILSLQGAGVISISPRGFVHPGGAHVITLDGYLVDNGDPTMTPSSASSWSGSVDIELR